MKTKTQIVIATGTLSASVLRDSGTPAVGGHSLEPNATASDGRHYAFQCWVDLNDENDKQLPDYGPHYGDTLIDVFTSLYNDLYNSCENRVVELARVVWPDVRHLEEKEDGQAMTTEKQLDLLVRVLREDLSSDCWNEKGAKKIR